MIARDQDRPVWTINNPAAFVFWMKTGASELPADWVDDSLATDDQGRDEIDRELEDDRVEVPWPEVNPPTRRKDAEVAHILDILDNLPTGKELA